MDMQLQGLTGLTWRRFALSTPGFMFLSQKASWVEADSAHKDGLQRELTSFHSSTAPGSHGLAQSGLASTPMFGFPEFLIHPPFPVSPLENLDSLSNLSKGWWHGSNGIALA